MRRVAAALIALCIGGAASAQEPRVETKTIELKQLKPAEAARLLRPYIVNTGGGVYEVSEMLPIITVKDIATNFEILERVLARYDQPPATIRLVFQLIEADTGPRVVATNNASAVPVDLDATLRSVLKFPSYRLLTQGLATVGQFSRVHQQFANADGAPATGMYELSAEIGTVRVNPSAPGDTATIGTVNMRVDLYRSATIRVGQAAAQRQTIISTGLDVPIGNTVVLGTAMSGRNGVALILTVRPELVRAK
jgi:type II secretory pathway component GspD/PulD (secretin)